MVRKWRVERSQGHWHVRISKDEVIDVDSKATAQLIAMAPEMRRILATIRKAVRRKRKS